ncbi:hypothetical protein [Lentzea flava]|uniref:Uncharacterized protein n=1 Tax=Lentzea flava TaxID=103732 RepID=A0ABQ2VCL1_9PSEU|nr:hypothetical protein [Lentzea flava]MCP2204606.1 hypothetical protein [Lentzea flava]GGU79643.1 hypothetical protein GCM10010178_83070 [Lentzea flava]
MRRIIAALGALVAAMAVVTPAGAATGDLASSCEIKLYTAGRLDGTFTVRGSYRLLGSLPAASPASAPLTADDWGLSVRLDLGDELAKRGVTKFDQGMVSAAYLSVQHDGVEDWPQKPLTDLGRDIAADQFATGVTSKIADAQVYPDAVPGHWRFASAGDIWLSFHKYSNTQVAMYVHCTADPGQDLFYAETTVNP